MILPRLVSKSTACYAEFSEYLIALHTKQKLNLIMIFIFSLGLHGMTEREIK